MSRSNPAIGGQVKVAYHLAPMHCRKKELVDARRSTDETKNVSNVPKHPIIVFQTSLEIKRTVI